MRWLANLRQALDDGGLNVFAVVSAAAYDASGPASELRAGALLPGARSWLLVGSGGRALWKKFTEWIAGAPQDRFVEEEHPIERYVREQMDRAERILEGAMGRRRFEPTFSFQPRVDFRRLAGLAGLGSPSPLGLIVHPHFGPWWAVRGAWLVDREVRATTPLGAPCDGCLAPCRAAIRADLEGTLGAATREARLGCRIGDERYDDEQLTYHYEPERGRALVMHRLGCGAGGRR